MIEKSPIDKERFGERIHSEWIWLDVFTMGFLISTTLTIFPLQLIGDGEMDKLLYFNLALSAVLVSRAVLKYHIGRNVYFPLPYKPKQADNGTKKAADKVEKAADKVEKAADKVEKAADKVEKAADKVEKAEGT